jgi:hypothetical protein
MAKRATKSKTAPMRNAADTTIATARAKRTASQRATARPARKVPALKTQATAQFFTVGV